jgi:hypothetical protein
MGNKRGKPKMKTVCKNRNKLISYYAYAFETLDRYDHQKLTIEDITRITTALMAVTSGAKNKDEIIKVVVNSINQKTNNKPLWIR